MVGEKVLYSSEDGLSKVHDHFLPFFPHLLTLVTSGRGSGASRGDDSEDGGNVTSWSAFVGHEPIHERHPTQFSSITTTGLLLNFLPSGLVTNGRRASKGQ